MISPACIIFLGALVGSARKPTESAKENSYHKKQSTHTQKKKKHHLEYRVFPSKRKEQEHNFQENVTYN